MKTFAVIKLPTDAFSTCFCCGIPDQCTVVLLTYTGKDARICDQCFEQIRQRFNYFHETYKQYPN